MRLEVDEVERPTAGRYHIDGPDSATLASISLLKASALAHLLGQHCGND